MVSFTDTNTIQQLFIWGTGNANAIDSCVVQLADTCSVDNNLILMTCHTFSTDIHVIVLAHTLSIDKLFIYSTSYHFFLANFINKLKAIVADTFLVDQLRIQGTET